MYFSDRKLNKVLNNSVWMVPPETLKAYLYNTDGKTVAVKDQTIWVINKYDQGYIFGNAYVTINGNTPASSYYLIGSVTPLGDVYIAFYNESSNPQTIGTGKLIKRHHKYCFIMQMSSDVTSTSGITHWSYMIPVSKDSKDYKDILKL
jgi:hypothetical protein